MNIHNSLRKTPVAIIGMSAIFAEARSIEEFWTNIIQGKNCIKEVPESRWRIEDYYDPDMNVPDKTYCKNGGFIPEIDFNPLEFGLPPNILEVTDVSQLLALVAARDALQDAGYGRESSQLTKELKEKTGVILGVGGGQKLITPLTTRLQYPVWENALRASGVMEKDIPPIIEKIKKAYVSWNENAFPGLLGNVISGRIANRFDLGGINCVVDAACAASLSAIKMALSELVERRCDMILTGGVDTDNSPFMYMSFSKTPAFSKSGNIRPFSEDADGMLIGEGIGMLVLKRLEDAERDNDRIYAVIKGVGSSSDGRFKSIYAPRASGQALAMTRAYEEAGYAPQTVGLIEAHGTGTEEGDPTEFASMQMVFGSPSDYQENRIALGSVKSQIGHTKAAAGAAGIIKIALGLYHKVLPPTINVDQPNSKFNIDVSPIFINTESRPWFSSKHPRRAGVSAFGFGGINLHLTLEEHANFSAANDRFHSIYHSIIVYASSPTKLEQKCEVLYNRLLESHNQSTFKDLIDESEAPRIPFENARIGFITKGVNDCLETFQIAISLLKENKSSWIHPRGIYFRSEGIQNPEDKIVALFSGQGSQYVGMGKEVINTHPVARDTFETCDQLFNANRMDRFTRIVYPEPVFSDEERKHQQETLTLTQFAQPAIGALSMGFYKIFQSAGFQPRFTAGHSFGELTALWAAGVFEDQTFLQTAKERGTAMANEDSKTMGSTMLAVKASLESVEEAIEQMEGIYIANVNSSQQIVLAGSLSNVRQAHDKLESLGIKVIPLQVSAAFHTHFVKHAQKPFSRFLNSLKFSRPEIPVYSNTTGEPYPENLNSLKSILKNQILNPVLFKSQIENIYRDGGRIFVEFGPKNILTNLVNDILSEKEHVAIAVNSKAVGDSDFQLRQAAIQLQVLGFPLGNIDPYQRKVPTPEKTALDVKISGNNYVSDSTQKAYADALSDGFQISGSKPDIQDKLNEENKYSPGVNKDVPIFQNETDEEMMNREIFQLLQSTLETFKENQTKSLEIFERFMRDQNQQAQQILQILANQINAQPSKSTDIPSADSIAQPVIKHVPEVKHQAPSGNGDSRPKRTASVPDLPATQSTPKPDRLTESDKLEKLLLQTVSEKTGFPTEILELKMDMEADLGIDSIKRVEIFGVITRQFPELSNINPNELTELRTLGQILEFIGGRSKEQTSETVPQPDPATSTSSNASTQVLDDKEISDLGRMILEVISDKTGYPPEMLEMKMDMEADLGIDSINRVEIFGMLTRKYPELSNINPKELTELRTLGAIEEFLSETLKKKVS